MFNNLKELVMEIESGKDTETIVNERLEFLNSKEYQKEMKEGGNDLEKVIQGFISDDRILGISNFIDETQYWIDEKDYYTVVIDNLIRPHLQELKKIQSLPTKNLINGVRYYFQNGKPDKDGIEVFKKMKQAGMKEGQIREDFGTEYKKYMLAQKDENDYKELEDKVDEFTPIPLSTVKGLGIGECLEMAMLSQNLLSFLGYNSFMILGKATNYKGEIEGHAFNCLEKGGKYLIFDSAMCFATITEDIKTPEDLLCFGEMSFKRGESKVTYFSPKEREKYKDPIKKMQALAVRGENYRNSAMLYLKKIEISKKLTKQSKETKDEQR